MFHSSGSPRKHRYSRRNRVSTSLTAIVITTSCLLANMCRHFWFFACTIICPCQVIIISAKPEWKCRRILWNFASSRHSTWVTIFRSRNSWIVVRHIDFRFNNFLYLLVLSAIVSGVLENINANCGNCHCFLSSIYPYFDIDIVEIIISPIFS